MTARTPQEPGDGNVSTTLSELERKLRRLEAELTTTGSPPATPAANGLEHAEPAEPVTPAAPPPSAAAPPLPPAPRPATGMGDADRLLAEARARLGGLTGQVDELLRFREQLQRTARELEAEYSRVLERIGAPPPADPVPAPASAPAAPAVTPPPPGQPAVPGVGTAPVDGVADGAPAAPPPAPPPAAPEPYQPPPAATVPPVAAPYPPPPLAAAPPAAAPPAAGAHDDMMFEGPVVIDAGPFTDIATLSTFEQGLARVQGVEDVYVSGFEGNRALIELRVAAPVALVREMRTHSGGIDVAEAAPGRLRVDVRPAGTGG